MKETLDFELGSCYILEYRISLDIALPHRSGKHTGRGVGQVSSVGGWVFPEPWGALKESFALSGKGHTEEEFFRLFSFGHDRFEIFDLPRMSPDRAGFVGNRRRHEGRSGFVVRTPCLKRAKVEGK